MSCACKLIRNQHAGCIGQFTPCTIRCRPLNLISAATEKNVPSCWEKTQPKENAQ